MERMEQGPESPFATDCYPHLRRMCVATRRSAFVSIVAVPTGSIIGGMLVYQAKKMLFASLTLYFWVIVVFLFISYVHQYKKGGSFSWEIRWKSTGGPIEKILKGFIANGSVTDAQIGKMWKENLWSNGILISVLGIGVYGFAFWYTFSRHHAENVPLSIMPYVLAFAFCSQFIAFASSDVLYSCAKLEMDIIVKAMEDVTNIKGKEIIPPSFLSLRKLHAKCMVSAQKVFDLDQNCMFVSLLSSLGAGIFAFFSYMAEGRNLFAILLCGIAYLTALVLFLPLIPITEAERSCLRLSVKMRACADLKVAPGDFLVEEDGLHFNRDDVDSFCSYLEAVWRDGQAPRFLTFPATKVAFVRICVVTITIIFYVFRLGLAGM